MSKVNFSNMNVSSKNVFDTNTKQIRKKKDVKSDKRLQIYLTADEEQELYNRADEEHITIKQYILKKTIYA